MNLAGLPDEIAKQIRSDIESLYYYAGNDEIYDEDLDIINEIAERWGLRK